MINRASKYERFMQDDIAIRLGGLATTLARVSSSARRPSGAQAVAAMLEESQWYIEWSAPDTEIEVASELVEIQRNLALWRLVWPEAKQFEMQRILLSVQSKTWADKVLDFSGLN